MNMNKTFYFVLIAIAHTVYANTLCGSEVIPLNNCGVVDDPTWESCCSVESACRHHMIQPPSDCDENTSVLKISVSFDESPDDCCKSCSVYGDPELFSFNDEKDKLILCDARDDTCIMHKSICEGLKDQNGNTCKWLADDDDSKNYKVGLNGSPCVPDTDIGPIPSSMVYKNDDIKIGVTMDERGVIPTMTITKNGVVGNFSAANCFDGQPYDDVLDEWGTFKQMSDTKTNKMWHMKIDDIFIKVLCIRTNSGNKFGTPRLNLQDISVPNTVLNMDSDSGICVDGVIPDISQEDKERSAMLHSVCVESVPNSLQACKAIIHPAMSNGVIDECGNTFCLNADLSVQNKKKCMSNIVDVNNDNKRAKGWLTYYCKSIIRSGKTTLSTNRCIAQIREQGWPWAVNMWGDGQVTSITEECYSGDKLSSFAINKRSECDMGITIEVFKNDEWVPKYFVPSNICSPVDLTVKRNHDSELFDNQIRISQCNNVDELTCGVERCKSVPQVTASVGFETLSGRLLEMYNNNELTLHKNL